MFNRPVNILFILTNLIILLVSLSIPYKVLAVKKINDVYTRVTAMLDDDGKVLDLAKIYGNPVNIRYAVPVSTFKIEIDGKQITIDYQSFVKEAISEWITMVNKFDPDSQISFTLVANPDEANVTFISDDDVTPSTPSAGVTTFNIDYVGKGAKKVVIYTQNILEIPNKHLTEFINLGVLPASTTKEEAYNLVLKWTLKHEIGHVLGLEHPEIICMEHVLADGTDMVSSSYIMLGSPESPSPPGIMAISAGSYFRALSDYLERPITINDISMTPDEGLAVSRLIHGEGHQEHATQYAYNQFSAFNLPISLTSLTATGCGSQQ